MDEADADVEVVEICGVVCGFVGTSSSIQSKAAFLTGAGAGVSIGLGAGVADPGMETVNS